MATLRNKQKLAAMARETQKYPRSNQPQNSAAPGITEDYMAEASEEIEGKVTKKLSKNSAGQGPASSVHCRCWTIFS